MSDPTAYPHANSVLSRIPVWMSRSVGYRFLVSMILLVDLGIQTVQEALLARYPGLAGSDALAYIARSRGMIRAMADTDATFAARLQLWLNRWQIAGSQLAIAHAIQDYVTGNPMVRVVNRAGVMTTLAANNGAVTVTASSGWNWDNLSDPGRAGYWSELWVIVYSPPWPVATFIGSSALDYGIGQNCPRVDVDAIKSLLDTWKSAHSYVRALIWSYDATLFDPTTPATMPDGTWGHAGYMTGTNLGLSTRGVKEQANSVRVWEPFVAPQLDFNGLGPV